jgi:exodeoxyribonuclease V beta subunit
MTPGPSLHEIPLSGLHLVEASAGTGKTTALTLLYLRALLEGTPVDRILVVTFTEAATEEVKGRIHALVRKARDFALTGVAEEKDLRVFGPVVGPSHGEILSRALYELDRAPVATIHAFCRRLLREYAFEFESPFSLTLEPDSGNLLSVSAREIWRRRVYPEDREVAVLIASTFPEGPEALKDLLTPSDLFVVEEDRSRPRWEEERGAYLSLLERCRRIGREERERFCLRWPELSGSIALGGSGRRKKPRADDPSFWTAEAVQNRLREICSGSPDAPAGFSPLDEAIVRAIGHCKEEGSFLEPVVQLIRGREARIRSLRESLRKDLVAYARSESMEEKERRGVETFDDMIFRVLKGLVRDRSGTLAEKIRGRFPVAFVDEFQDTDIAQYRIFDRIYRMTEVSSGREKATGALFLIGDPKQSIYGFRGADMSAYLDARQSVLAAGPDRLFSLTVNYRSDEGHVEAVNRLFGDSADPFLTGGKIDWSPSASHRKGRSGFEDPLSGGGDFRAPVLFRVGTGAKEETLDTFADLCAAEVSRLLSPPVLLDGRGVQPGEIAILVRKHTQGERIKKALSLHGIPSVSSEIAGILDTDEATDLEMLLLALSNPGNRRPVRSVLASSFYGISAQDLLSLEESPGAWNERVEAFFSTAEQWNRTGPLGSLRRFFLDEGIFARLGRGTEGRRRITNLLHLFEILEEMGRDRCPLLLLVDRFAEARLSAQRNKEKREPFRLDSFGDRVRIMTLHKSKGLEFPIVLLPFGLPFRKSSGEEEEGEDGKEVTGEGSSQESFSGEGASEEMRLLYVALTRAAHRTAVMIPVFRQKQRALAHLLGLPPDFSDLRTTARNFQEKIAGLIRESPDLFGPIPDPSEARGHLSPHPGNAPPTQRLRARECARPVPSPRTLESFTSLSRSLEEDPGNTDRDLAPWKEKEEGDRGEAEGSGRLPAGPLFGTFFHRIMEILASEGAGNPVPADRLREIGSLALRDTGAGQNPLCLDWPERVIPLVERTLRTPLSGGCPPGAGFPEGATLGTIFGGRRTVEREFLMPVHRLGAAPLMALLPDSGPRLTFDCVTGYLRGFVDLIFCLEGRYYLLDYKTNLLSSPGGRPPYGRENLQAAMAEHRYDLQGLIYSLALHRLLSREDPAYSYETGFGGIFFLFVRGLSSGTQFPGSGIFYDRPSFAKIDGVDRLLRGTSVETEEGR